MISNISVESVIILLLLLIHQSILDELLPNLTTIAKDSTTEYPHYGNIDKDYHSGDISGAIDDYRGKLQVETVDIKGNNTGEEINKASNDDKTNEAEEVVSESKIDEPIKIVQNYSRVLNETLLDSNSADKLESLKNDTVNYELKTKDEITKNKTDCLSSNNKFCDNDTKKHINSSIQLPDIPKKIDNFLESIPSTITTPSSTEEPSIDSQKFKGDGPFFLNEASTTESDIITLLIQHIEDDVSGNDITKTESSNDGEKYMYSSKDSNSQLEGQSEYMNGVSSNTADKHSTSSPSGFSTSTSSVDFSSILPQVDSVAHKKTPKQKNSSPHKADVPDFTKSNGRNFTRIFLFLFFVSREFWFVVEMNIGHIFPVALFECVKR